MNDFVKSFGEYQKTFVGLVQNAWKAIPAEGKDIVRAIDGPVLTPLPVKDTRSADMALPWKETALGIEHILQGTTVRGILDRAAKSSMYYI